WSRTARLFRLVAVSGCSGPSAFSLIASARSKSGRAPQHDCTTFIVPHHVNRDLSFVAYRTDFNSSSPRPAEKSRRRLDGHNQLPKVVLGVKFADGIEVIRSQAQVAAA